MTALSDLGYFRAAYGLAAAVLPYLLRLFLRDRPLASLPEAPDTVSAFVGWKVRTFGAAVEETAGAFHVELGRYAAVQLRVVASEGGSKVVWRPWLTNRGWGTLTFLMVFGLFFPAFALLLGLNGARRGKAFVNESTASTISADGHLPAPPDELQFLLLRNLSDALRLARNAHESAVLRYSDLRAI